MEGGSHDEVVEALEWGDVYVGTLLVGQLGGSEREAMARGLCVVTRLQPVVRTYMYGCPVVNVRSVGEMRDALKALMHDRDLVAELKQNSRKWINSFFSYEALGPVMEAFFEYVHDCDDLEQLGAHAAVWQRVAKEEHGVKEFVDPCRFKW